MSSPRDSLRIEKNSQHLRNRLRKRLLRRSNQGGGSRVEECRVAASGRQCFKEERVVSRNECCTDLNEQNDDVRLARIVLVEFQESELAGSGQVEAVSTVLLTLLPALVSLALCST